MSDAMETTTTTALSPALVERIKGWYQNADALAVEDDETAVAAETLINSGRTLLDDVQGVFKPVKQRLDAIKRSVLDREGSVVKPLETAYSRLRLDLGNYLQKKRKAEEEQRRRDAATATPTSTTLKQAPAAAPTPAPTAQTRTMWRWKVADPTKLPPAFQIVTVTPNAEMIDAVVQKLHEQHGVPGVEVWAETVVVAKRRTA